MRNFEDTLKAANINNRTRKKIMRNTFVYQGGMYRSPEQLRQELIRRINESIFGDVKLEENADFDQIAYNLIKIENEIQDESDRIEAMFY